MYSCLLICRSVTYAQRISRALNQAGFLANQTRLPSGLLDSGCGHAVKVYDYQITDILAFLQEKGFPGQRVLCEFESGRYEEWSV